MVGWAEFCGLRIAVAPGVFVPRQRTELMARRAAALAGRRRRWCVDLCCGTGAVGAAVLAAVPERRGVRRRRSTRPRSPAPGATCRRTGSSRATCTPRCRRRCAAGSTCWRATRRTCPTDAIALMPPEARDHEHRVALDGGADGLDVQRRVAAGAPAWLAPGGHLLVETSVAQAPATAALMTAAGLDPEVVHDEEIGGTVVIGAQQATGLGDRP